MNIAEKLKEHFSSLGFCFSCVQGALQQSSNYLDIRGRILSSFLPFPFPDSRTHAQPLSTSNVLCDFSRLSLHTPTHMQSACSSSGRDEFEHGRGASQRKEISLFHCCDKRLGGLQQCCTQPTYTWSWQCFASRSLLGLLSS